MKLLLLLSALLTGLVGAAGDARAAAPSRIECGSGAAQAAAAIVAVAEQHVARFAASSAPRFAQVCRDTLPAHIAAPPASDTLQITGRRRE